VRPVCKLKGVRLENGEARWWHGQVKQEREEREVKKKCSILVDRKFTGTCGD